jgi:hypothetical protein
MSVRRRLSPCVLARRFAGTIPRGRASPLTRVRARDSGLPGNRLWSSSQLTTTSAPQSARRNVAQFRSVSSWCSAPNVDEW